MIDVMCRTGQKPMFNGHPRVLTLPLSTLKVLHSGVALPGTRLFVSSILVSN